MSSIFTRKDPPLDEVNYSVEKLPVTSVYCQTTGHSDKTIVCDIDKTYIETNFETFVQMARTAIEDAKEKKTVLGADEVLKSAHWNSSSGKPNPLHFVTASPPQLKSVLEEKLGLDDIHWNSMTYKNQAYNLRKGKMSLLRHHVAYKTLSLFKILAHSFENTSLYLVGDNAELDSFIYLGVKFFLDGTLSKEGYAAYLESAGTDPMVVKDLMGIIHRDRGCKVSGIYIRLVPGLNTYKAGRLTETVTYFDNFYEVALDFYQKDVLHEKALWPLTRVFHNRFQVERLDLASYIQNCMALLSEDKKRVCEKILSGLAITQKDLLASENENHLKGPAPKQPHAALKEEEVVSLAGDWMKGVRASK